MSKNKHTPSSRPEKITAVATPTVLQEQTVNVSAEDRSVAIDGISLTVAQIRGESFAAAVVPHTEEITTLKDKAIGSAVNVEVDVMAKYVKRFVDLYAGTDAGPASEPRRGLGDMLRDFADGK